MAAFTARTRLRVATLGTGVTHAVAESGDVLCGYPADRLAAVRDDDWNDVAPFERCEQCQLAATEWLVETLLRTPAQRRASDADGPEASRDRSSASMRLPALPLR